MVMLIKLHWMLKKATDSCILFQNVIKLTDLPAPCNLENFQWQDCFLQSHENFPWVGQSGVVILLLREKKRIIFFYQKVFEGPT